MCIRDRVNTVRTGSVNTVYNLQSLSLIHISKVTLQDLAKAFSSFRLPWAVLPAQLTLEEPNSHMPAQEKVWSTTPGSFSRAEAAVMILNTEPGVYRP